MIRTTSYTDLKGKKIPINYNDEAACISCGEPVISASMGGTAICPWCDTGRCRYCGMQVFTFKDEIDGGESKRKLRQHMAWHKKEKPKFNEELLIHHREFERKWREKYPSKELNKIGTAKGSNK